MKLAAGKVEAFVNAFPPKEMPRWCSFTYRIRRRARYWETYMHCLLGAEPDPLQRVDLNDTEVGGGASRRSRGHSDVW